MQVHDLQPKKSKKKKRKRVGRGGKRGTFSGRGVKGQKARAGGTTPSYTKKLIKKFPKLRGVKNKSKRPEAHVVNVGELNDNFEGGDKITKKILKEKGLIGKNVKRIKILGNGEIEKELTVEDLSISELAKEKIEKAGGKVN